MRYRPRHIEGRLRALAEHFKIVLVTGARQVGKSTLLSHTFGDLKSIVFDPVQDLYGARSDPDLFLDHFPAPIILDEVQFAPELLPAIKRRVDEGDATGQYFLTGSQNLSVLRSVAESMAGRVGIIHLDGMTPAEVAGQGSREGWLASYLDDPDSFPSTVAGKRFDVGEIGRFLWRGSLPGLLDMPDEMIPDYFRSYIQTYIERDVRTMENIRALAEFDRFLGLTGALTSNEINTSQIGRDVGVNPSTARDWLDLLANTYQWIELPPYHGNTIKRLSGKKKGCLSDTGLACFLQRISSPQALVVNPQFGAIFETWACGFILRQFSSIAVPPQVYHWRTGGGAEVDLVLERDGRLYPIEMKCKTNVTKRDASGLRAFRETYGPDRVANGIIIYVGREIFRVDEHTIAMPWNMS